MTTNAKPTTWPPERGTFRPHQLLNRLVVHLRTCGDDELRRIVTASRNVIRAAERELNRRENRT